MKNVIKKIYYLPLYILMQIFVRIPGESSDRWNKWQPTRRQSLSEFIDYSLEFSAIPTNQIVLRMWAISILITTIILITSI